MLAVFKLVLHNIRTVHFTHIIHTIIHHTLHNTACQDKDQSTTQVINCKEPCYEVNKELLQDQLEEVNLSFNTLLLHTACKFVAKIASTNENPLYICGETVHLFFCAKSPLYICGEKVLLQKPVVYTVHTAVEFTTKMGEVLIDLVHQYPALWDKQDAMYKDSNYKEAKWKEITEILCLNKEDVIKKWKSLRDTYVRQKNIKSKSRDGLSQCKPKQKYYDIMSIIDITLLK